MAAERKRVLRGSGRNDLLRIENLAKVGYFVPVMALILYIERGTLRGVG